MGITVKKHKGSWWVFINYHGRRKAKKVGSEKAALAVKLKLETALALGDFSCLQDEKQDVTFEEYSKKALAHLSLKCKQSTIDSYKEYQQRYVLPRFGDWKLRTISKDDIKSFLTELTEKKLALNTIRLALASMRTVLTAAMDDDLIAVNPALKLLRFTNSEIPKHQSQSMEPAEVKEFLQTACDYYPDYYPLFLIAIYGGLRQGEILGLKWSDCQFGKDEGDLDRYFFVQRRWYRGRRWESATWSSPKGRKSRRVDMSKETRRALIELRDKRMLEAFQMGRQSISDDLVFPGEAEGRPITIRTLEGHFKSILEKAGLRQFRFHDLRHTFGSLLIQEGAPLPYVSAQMGHSSIKVTAEIYIKLIRSENVGWVDRIDGSGSGGSGSVQPDATQAQPVIKKKNR